MTSYVHWFKADIDERRESRIVIAKKSKNHAMLCSLFDLSYLTDLVTRLNNPNLTEVVKVVEEAIETERSATSK